MHASCSGCSLCLLVCPVWHQTGDVRLTPHGRAKASQHGADARMLAASAAACTLCMACEPACPEELPLVDMILALRREAPLAPADAIAFLPAEADDGSDIALAIEAGVRIPEDRLRGFLEPLKNRKTVVVADGLLLRSLREWLPRTKVISLGEHLTSQKDVRRKLGPGDLYVIEPRAFHADYERLVGHYDALRTERGCAMNLDLQRIAIPTTASAAQRALGLPAVEVARQARWILEGLDVKRIVVEDARDAAAFAFAKIPVLHVAAL